VRGQATRIAGSFRGPSKKIGASSDLRRSIDRMRFRRFAHCGHPLRRLCEEHPVTGSQTRAKRGGDQVFGCGRYATGAADGLSAIRGRAELAHAGRFLLSWQGKAMLPKEESFLFAATVRGPRPGRAIRGGPKSFLIGPLTH
jgi:hypothetical protein